MNYQTQKIFKLYQVELTLIYLYEETWRKKQFIYEFFCLLLIFQCIVNNSQQIAITIINQVSILSRIPILILLTPYMNFMVQNQPTRLRRFLIFIINYFQYQVLYPIFLIFPTFLIFPISRLVIIFWITQLGGLYRLFQIHNPIMPILIRIQIPSQ